MRQQSIIEILYIIIYNILIYLYATDSVIWKFLNVTKSQCHDVTN